MNAKKYNPKSPAEFEAYARAMDAANNEVVKGAKAGPKKTTKETETKKPTPKKAGKK